MTWLCMKITFVWKNPIADLSPPMSSLHVLWAHGAEWAQPRCNNSDFVPAAVILSAHHQRLFWKQLLACAVKHKMESVTGMWLSCETFPRNGREIYSLHLVLIRCIWQQMLEIGEWHSWPECIFRGWRWPCFWDGNAFHCNAPAQCRSFLPWQLLPNSFLTVLRSGYVGLEIKCFFPPSQLCCWEKNKPNKHKQTQSRCGRAMKEESTVQPCGSFHVAAGCMGLRLWEWAGGSGGGNQSTSSMRNWKNAM